MQKLINLFYRLPRSKVKTYRRFGGYFNYRSMIAGNREMQKAVKRLPPSLSFPDGLPVYFLTGKNYLHQTLFCIRSLLAVSAERFHFILVDDGTFDAYIYQVIREKLPGATVIPDAQISNNLKTHLPQEKYPVLNRKRTVYPHIKKLTDIHTIQPGDWKLILDSDMLFWKEPSEITGWLKAPSQPMHMLDCMESYGYTRALMEDLAGVEVPELLNVGVIGLNSLDLPWEDIEHWINVLEEKEGTSYYLEQTISAMLVGQTRSTVLDRNDYKVNPTDRDFGSGDSILHHYVDLSKEIYFKKAWQLIL